MVKGRKADPHQAAKGNPGRRRSKVAQREAEQQRVAELLAANASSDPATPPPMIDQGPLYEGAVAVWREMAPRLARTHRLSDTHKLIFSMFCVYYADWISLNDQLKREGMTQSVKTVAGGTMIRDHPAVRRRQECFDNVMKLSAQFGLTPHDEYDLFKNQSLAAAMNPGLFGNMPAQPKGDSAAPAPQATGPRAGMLRDFDSMPPAGTA
ncbi:MAG: P27 family phage terminase small subunit [Sphingopyxis sp.]